MIGELEVQLNSEYTNSVISRLELPELVHHSVQANHSEIGNPKSCSHCCTAERQSGCGKVKGSSHTPGGSASESAEGGQRFETSKVKDPETNGAEALVQPQESADSKGVSHGETDDHIGSKMSTQVQRLVNEENTCQVMCYVL